MLFRSSGGSGGNGSVVDVTAPVTACGTGVAVVGGASASCGTAGGGTGGSGGGTGGSGGGGSTVGVDGPVTVGGVGAYWNGQLEAAPASRPHFTDGGAPPAFGASNATDGRLAYTGTELALPLLAGLLTLALGLGLTVASRRRLGSAVL